MQRVLDLDSTQAITAYIRGDEDRASGEAGNITNTSSTSSSTSNHVEIGNIGTALADAITGDPSLLFRGMREFFVKDSSDHTVAIFRYSIWFYIDYFSQPCNIDATLGSSRDMCQDHSGKVSHAVVTVGVGLLVYAILISFFAWVPLPLMWASVVAAFAYLALVYSYVPRCLPQLPLCLVDDVRQWVYDNELPQCFCSIAKPLMQNASDCGVSPCTASNAPYKYNNCPARQTVYWWTMLYGLRWQLPSVLVWFWNHSLLPNYSEIAQLVQDAQQQTKVLSQDVACFWATFLNIPLTMVILATAIACAVTIAVALVNFIIGILYTLFYLVQGSGGSECAEDCSCRKVEGIKEKTQ